MSRSAKINKQTVYYAFYQGVTEMTDSDGNYTGEYSVQYSEPIEAKMNVSPTRGTAHVAEFGIDNPYERVIVTEDNETPFDTDTVFWVGVKPTETYIVEGVTNVVDVPHNYMVTSVARGLPRSSLTRIAIKEVEAG